MLYLEYDFNYFTSQKFLEPYIYRIFDKQELFLFAEYIDYFFGVDYIKLKVSALKQVRATEKLTLLAMEIESQALHHLIARYWP